MNIFAAVCRGGLWASAERKRIAGRGMEIEARIILKEDERVARELFTRPASVPRSEGTRRI